MEMVDSQSLIGPSLSTLNDEPQQIEKLKPLELLKMKMCKSHDLIMNYNDKLKECINLKNSLEQAQNKAKNMETKYMSTLQKLINVELQNTNFRKSLEDSKKKIVNLETKTAGDQRLIQQLTCKIEDNDEKNADKLMDADLNKLKLEEKIKSLEQEIKTLKKPRPDKKTLRKHKGVNTEQVQIVDYDYSLNADANLLEDRLRGSEFNESVEVKEENSFSILCAKCDVAVDKLIHSFEPPEALVTPISSPIPQFYPNEIQSLIEPTYSPMRGREVVEPEHLTDPPKDINLESETIKALEKRLKNLERKIKRQNKIEDKNRCCHSSSNSYFPNSANQDIMLEIWKKLLDKDKSACKLKRKKKLKRCKNKRKVISKKKDRRKSLQNWSVESAIASDNLIQENLEIIDSRKKSSEPQIEKNCLEESRECPGPSRKKELISFLVSNESELPTLILENKYEKRTSRKENEDFEKDLSRKTSYLSQVILEEESVFIIEKSKEQKQTNITQDNNFEMLEVSHDKILTSSPNIETPKIQETDTISIEAPTLWKEIANPKESILNQEKQINATKENNLEMLEISRDTISISLQNIQPPKIQETDIFSKEASMLWKVIPNSVQSILNQEKQINAAKENNLEISQLDHDKISANSPNASNLQEEFPDKVEPQYDIVKAIQENVSLSTESPTLPKMIPESLKNQEKRINSTHDFETLKVSDDKISANSQNIETLIQEKKSPASPKIQEAEESVLFQENSKENLRNSISTSSPNIIETSEIHGSQKDSENVLNKPSTSEGSRKILKNGIQSPKGNKSLLFIQEKETNDFKTLEVGYDKMSASSRNIERLIQEKESLTPLKIPPGPEESVLILEKSEQNLRNSIFASSPNSENDLNKLSTLEESRKILEIGIHSAKGNKSLLLNQENEANFTKDFETLEVSHDTISASSPNIEKLIQKKVYPTPLKILEPEESVLMLEKSEQDLPNPISASSPNIIETSEIDGSQKDSENDLNKPSTSEESRKILENRIQSLKGNKSLLLNQENETNSTKEFDTLEVSHDIISASSPNIEKLIQKKVSPTPLKIQEPEESVVMLENLKQNHSKSISTSLPNIIETPKILGNREDQGNVLNKPSTSEESQKILECRTQSMKRKKSSSPQESHDHIHNLPVLGEHSRKMVRRRLSSHYSTDSLDVELARNSSDFQRVHSEKTCMNLVMNPEKGEGNIMPEEFSEVDESSISDQVQIMDTIPSFEMKEELEFTEEISQELANSFNEKRTSDLLDELALSDDEPPEEVKTKSNSSLEDTSHIFISNSNKNDAKNFIQGKRSSALLLTVISPVSQAKRMKKVDLKNSKLGNRGNLLTKIRTLKRRTNKMVLHPIVKKSEEKNDIKVEPKSEIENNVESVASNCPVHPKKRRIAHTPKAESESGSVTSFEDFPLEIPIRKSLRSASKSPGKNKRIKSSEEKSADLEEKFPVRKKGRPRKVKVPDVNSVDLSIKAERKEDLRTDVEPLNLCSDKSQSEDLIKSSVQENSNLTNNTSSDEDVALASRIVVKNEYWERAKKVLESIKETDRDDDASVRELRSRQVEVAAEENLEKPGIWKKRGKSKFLPVHPKHPLLKTHYVVKLLNETFEEKPFVDLRQKSKLSQGSLEKNVKLQLSRLVMSESWTVELHLDVIKNLTELCQASTAAKCIVIFLQNTFEEEEEPLDKSNTPPAPMMSRTQQKIVTLIASLEKTMPNIFDLVSAGIDYSLFRLNEEHKDRNVIEGLARVYIVLARLKKDREKARLFCCDALYCLRNNAVTVIYVVLTCWPEVFPICDTNPEILPKCMAHIILTTEGCGIKYPKVGALKNLISAYYQYPRAEYFSKQLATEFLSALKQKHENSTDMAIILLAKKEGPDWTYKNIIQGGLLQMIVEKTHPSVYDAFSLLGNLMRTFPKEDKENYIGKTVQQLCDLLDSSQGAEDHLEGVATALLSLAKFTNHLDKIAKCLLLWKPNQTLRPETIVKFKFFFQSRTTAAWHNFIVNDFKNLTEPRLNNNVHNKKPQLNISKVQIKKKKNNRRRTKKANTSVKVPSNS
ncbi:titin homolog isoform X2 [Belonocnema kinseyi]|uniref:titin homolog isoform X2 n=1 Tax=Belonocnema kinseyi TaxID=2817044 RepID=UPI00143D8D27|nr:titin homolog isoform X2 [Belonocnema kinseyi]